MSKVNNSAVAITATNSTNVDFSNTVDNVKEALKSRSQAQRDVKLKYAEVVKLLQEGGRGEYVASRRMDVDTCQAHLTALRIYKPLPPRKFTDEDYEALNYLDNALEYITGDKADVIEEHFKGFSAFVKKSRKQYRLCRDEDERNRSQERDEQKTEALKVKYQKAIDEYREAVEAYNDTLDSVANSKEYVAFIKDVAEISAIANGTAQATINR